MSHTFTFQSAILGGTFDHFHVGHEHFITSAFAKANHITIGIVSDSLSVIKLFSTGIEEYSLRLENLKSFLYKNNLISRASIIPINDFYGTTLTDKSIQAIFVTDATKSNAEIINLERSKLGLSQLEIVLIGYSLSNDGGIVSSSRIRAGEINRQGESYLKLFLQKDKYLMPDNLRTVLQQPLGTVVTNIQDIRKLIPRSSTVISVGDIVSTDLIKAKLPSAISIIDYQTRREKIDISEIKKYFPIVNATFTNPAGCINSEIGNILTTSINNYQKTNNSQVIAISGEEDLIALPVLLLAPIETYLIYGQYNVGMVVVKITEDIKTLAKNYLKMFN